MFRLSLRYSAHVPLALFSENLHEHTTDVGIRHNKLQCEPLERCEGQVATRASDLVLHTDSCENCFYNTAVII